MRRGNVGTILYASAAAFTATPGSRSSPRTTRRCADLDLRRQQARRRGADLGLRLHVRHPRRCFRFGNVVGNRQTHGVGFDFVRRLRADGTKRAFSAMAGRTSPTFMSRMSSRPSWAREHTPDDLPSTTWRPATPATVNDIAELACEVVGLDPRRQVRVHGGDRGWKGDVPVVKLDVSRILALAGPARPSRSARLHLKPQFRSHLWIDLTDARSCRAVFLDRDGVINDPCRSMAARVPGSARRAAHSAGRPEASRRLKEAGFC